MTAIPPSRRLTAVCATFPFLLCCCRGGLAQEATRRAPDSGKARNSPAAPSVSAGHAGRWLRHGHAYRTGEIVTPAAAAALAHAHLASSHNKTQCPLQITRCSCSRSCIVAHGRILGRTPRPITKAGPVGLFAVVISRPTNLCTGSASGVPQACCQTDL